MSIKYQCKQCLRVSEQRFESNSALLHWCTVNEHRVLVLEMKNVYH